jgi:hypothetical protein
MKIHDPVIAPEKLTRYLLVKRPRGDKSGYLALAGFTADDPDALLVELLALADRGEALEQETDRFGTRYRLEGTLRGPNGLELAVATIWLRKADGRVHFVTLMPGRRE